MICDAIHHCEERLTANPAPHLKEAIAAHKARLDRICAVYLPSGSGIDSGTQIDIAKSGADKLVFNTSFHHMDEWGSYDGWTDHVVTVKPSLALYFTVSVSGRDRNDIKDYLAEVFHVALAEEVNIH
jgi:hypothetical protein